MVDQNPESIEVMTARYAKAGLGNVRFVELTHQLAFVAQRIEHLTTDQKVGGSSPSKRTKSRFLLTRTGIFSYPFWYLIAGCSAAW